MNKFCRNQVTCLKTNYDRSFNRFDDPRSMALVFLDRFPMVNKPVNARGARSLNIFPCFACDILEMTLERKQWLKVTTKMQISTEIEF